MTILYLDDPKPTREPDGKVVTFSKPKRTDCTRYLKGVGFGLGVGFHMFCLTIVPKVKETHTRFFS